MENRELNPNKMGAAFSGVLHDVNQVARLELNLFRAQIREDLQEQRDAGIMTAVSVTLVLFALALVALGVVQFLLAQTPLPIWGCYLSVAALFLLLGVIVFQGRTKWAKQLSQSQES